jgi:dTDP-4-amino-4,6-dideoxygalactose transaminase
MRQELGLRSAWPVFEEDEIEAVVQVLRSGRVNALHHGERCAELESAFASLCNVPFAIALSNGTVALELALRALGIGRGDEVIVPPRSFFASAGCVVTVGATPVFADVEIESQNIDPEAVAPLITKRTRAVIAVHLAGWPCELERLRQICDDRGLYLIEDCAQALGATHDGRPVGSFGDASVFSFCTDKIISTGGEGGLLLVRDEAVYERAWSFKDHGKSRSKMALSRGSAGRFQWLHDSFGSNFRLTEMQAAIGLVQLGKLERRIALRRRNAAILASELGKVQGVVVDVPGPSSGHAYYKFYARLDDQLFDLPFDRDSICSQICARGPLAGSGSCPEIYLEQSFRSAGIGPSDRLERARRLGRSSLMLQCDHTLEAGQMAGIGRIAAEVIEAGGTRRAAA